MSFQRRTSEKTTELTASVPVKLLTAGSAACFADFITFPLDTAKVRLQTLPPMRMNASDRANPVLTRNTALRRSGSADDGFTVQRAHAIQTSSAPSADGLPLWKPVWNRLCRYKVHNTTRRS
uniref:Uncharacterized protein n=1 Tax=Anopheles maculatus TaxID=74869 RepID=A0A182SWC9_9DIPT